MKPVLALVSGLLITLSLAPFGLWPAALVSAALLFYCLEDAGRGKSAKLGWLFGLGLFGSGASWVYVSIHEFGYQPPVIAAILTFAFCAGLALCCALTFYLYACLRSDSKLSGASQSCTNLSNALLFSACWISGEWLRSWLLTGFPWLFIGYSQTSGPLAGLSPLIGVYGVGFVICLSAAIGQTWVSSFTSQTEPAAGPLRVAVSIGLVAIWLLATPLAQLPWTSVSEQARQVSMVQANISQHDKWRPQYREPTLALYESMSEDLWSNSELLIWPEAAIPMTRNRAQPYLDKIAAQATRNNSALLTGIPVQSINSTHNSAMIVGQGNGIYHKHRLVPFGEYVPFATLLDSTMRFFDLPLSSMTAGAANQAALTIQDWHARPLICYEVVYPSIAANTAMHSDVLITISNDSWFGASLGPLQHLQMAQMRALETGRYVLRSTGNGVSAIISPQGKIMARSEQFEQQVLTGSFHLSTGLTPWVAAGYWLVPALICSILPLCWLLKSRQRRTSTAT